jgi:hypothetical protein
MLDTTEFNLIAKGQVSLSAYAGRQLFVTHVQFDELENTTSDEMRARLLAVFDLQPQSYPPRVPYGTSASGIKQRGLGKTASSKKCSLALSSLMEGRSARINNATSSSRKLLLETDMTLMSDDPRLRAVTIEFGGCAEPVLQRK